MKQVFTKSKAANRGPKKYNFNNMQTLPVEIRRKMNVFGADHREWDNNLEEKLARKAASEKRNNPLLRDSE